MDGNTEDSPPFLRIVRGSPSIEEIAVLVAVLSAASAARETAVLTPVFAWSARSRLLRDPVSPGHGGWRASAATQ